MNEKDMRARLAEIDERMPLCRSELLTLADGDLGEAETTRFEELETEHRTLTDEREPLTARLAQIDNIRETHTRAQTAGRGVERGAGPAFVASERRDPYADLDQVRGGMVAAGDMRARALTAIESTPNYVGDDAREAASRLVERNDRHGRIARHMLLTGNDAYVRAFENLLGGVQPWQLDADEQDALRASMSLTDANGGYLAPFFIDPTVVLTNAGSTNPFRRISRVESITTDKWHGITSAGVTASWLAENTAATDASPTFAQPEITPQKAAAWLTGSFEVTEDTNIGSQVGMLLADARDNLEATAFATGSGSGQPFGAVTSVAAVSGSVVASATADTYAVGDVYALANAVPARWQDRAQWVMNKKIAIATRQFASGTGPQHAFWADLGMGTPSQLLGAPVYESSAMDGVVDASANNDILLLGDFSQYLIVDRIGMTVQYDPLVKNSSGLPLGQVGWFAHWRVGADVLVPDAFRLLRA